jgi:probable rRNA maturation factor
MNHKIYIKNGMNRTPALDPRTLRAAITVTLRAEGVAVPCEVSVLLTDDAGIQAVNRAFRSIDAPTDVLSFPLQTFKPGAFDARDADFDLSSGRVPLGDVVLSLARCAAQAREYGHTAQREAAYLTVHSVLHLLGYDHMDEGAEKARMRAREEAILRELGYAEEKNHV